MVRVAVLLMLLIAALGYAFWRGGAPERVMAALWLVLLAADPILHVVEPLDYQFVDRGHLAIDIVGSAGAFIIALYAYRFWPLIVAPLQFLPILAHFSRAIDFTMHPTAYLIMQVASYWPLTPILIIGTWRHYQRAKRDGSEPDWVGWAPWPFQRTKAIS